MKGGPAREALRAVNPPTGYFRPDSVADALEILARVDQARVVAGGTDWMLSVRTQGQVPAAVVDIFRLEELQGLIRHPDALEIGAAVTVARLLASAEVARDAPLLAQAADRFGSPPVRSRATIGGNLCNASPAADLTVALLASDATVEVASRRCRRSLAIRELVLGPRRTALASDELLVSVRVPIRPGAVWAFQKSGRRPALEISAAAVAFSAVLQDGHLREPRIACGAVAPTPMRALQAERLIADRRLDPSLILACARRAAAEVEPIDDVRGSALYRRRLVGAFVSRCLEGCHAG